MELSRRQALGALGIAAVAAALPASAAKAVTTPLFYGVFTVAWSGHGLYAEVYCEVGVASVTARMFNQDRTVEIGRYTLTLQPGDNPVRGRWLAPLSGIPFGNHVVDYEATSTDGGVATHTAEFHVWWLADCVVTVTPWRIDDLHRTITVAGTATSTHPLTGEQAPTVGHRIDIETVYMRPEETSTPPAPLLLTTDADGTFSTQLTLAGSAEIRMKSHDYGPDLLVWLTGLGTQWIYVTPRPTRITAELGAAQLSLGESTTFEGLAEALVDGQWQPLTGCLIQIEFEPASGSGAIFEHQLNTDGQGRFRVTVRPPSTGRYIAVFNRGKPNEFFEPSSYHQSVSVLQPVRFSTDYFIVQPTPDWRDDPANYQMTGIIYTVLNPAVIQIQYRPGQSGDWQTLSTTTESHGSNDGGKVFTGWFTMPDSGQIRAFAPPTSFTQSAASKVVSINLPGRLVPQRPPGGGGTTPTLPPQRRY